jgi:hydrogenase maturation protease
VSDVRVIACGNPEAGDDAAGLAAVRLAGDALERVKGVDVLQAGTALRVLDLLPGAEAVVVVDAVRSAGTRRPGELVRVEGEELPAGIGSSAMSSHGFDLADALAVAALTGYAPRIVFLGVEAADVEQGHPMSAQVAEAVPRLAELIEAEVEFLLQGQPEPGKSRL